jgi:hypothetical protein
MDHKEHQQSTRGSTHVTEAAVPSNEKLYLPAYSLTALRQLQGQLLVILVFIEPQIDLGAVVLKTIVIAS